MKKQAIAALLLALVPAAALATPGRTDANGGHYDHTTGLYHYHHGYTAHQHENGICPYTGKVWELKIPERPATLAEWNRQKHAKGDVAVIDNETAAPTEQPTPAPTAVCSTTDPAALAVQPTPTVVCSTINPATEAPTAVPVTPEPAAETQKPAKTVETLVSQEIVPTAEKPKGSALPAAAAGAAVLAGGAAAFLKLRKKKKEEIIEEEELEADIPEDSVIGEDGLPWEEAAHDAWLEYRKKNPQDRSTPTSKSAPKWGEKYTFYLDGDGSEIHTRDCPASFIQINAADPSCPKIDCPKCHPTRPDLSWYETWKAKQEKAENPEKNEKEKK